MAAMFNEKDIATALIRYGVDVNEQCKLSGTTKARFPYGATALHLAIAMQHDAMIRLLVEQGARLKVIRTSGKVMTAPPRWLIVGYWLEISQCRNVEQVIRILETLLSLGWDINAELTHSGKTFLQLARAYYGHGEEFRRKVVKYLKQNGAR